MSMRIPAIIGCLLLIGTAGCAQYEYDITRPAEYTTHVSSKDDTVFARPPFEYRLRAADNRLVVRIQNKTDDNIQLLGDRSSVVDPNGQSHPLRSQAMAPNSYIKLILPPYRPTVRQSGPSFGIGVGTRVGERWRPGYDDFDDPYYDQPRYLSVYDDDALYWNWQGEGDIRLLLVFQQNDRTFNHEFVIRRVKVK